MLLLLCTNACLYNCRFLGLSPVMFLREVNSFFSDGDLKADGMSFLINRSLFVFLNDNGCIMTTKTKCIADGGANRAMLHLVWRKI